MLKQNSDHHIHALQVDESAKRLLLAAMGYIATNDRNEIIKDACLVRKKGSHADMVITAVLKNARNEFVLVVVIPIVTAIWVITRS